MKLELWWILDLFYFGLFDYFVVLFFDSCLDILGMGDKFFWFFYYEWLEEISLDLSKFNCEEVRMIIYFVFYFVKNDIFLVKIMILIFYNG